MEQIKTKNKPMKVSWDDFSILFPTEWTNSKNNKTPTRIYPLSAQWKRGAQHQTLHQSHACA